MEKKVNRTNRIKKKSTKVKVTVIFTLVYVWASWAGVGTGAWTR